MTCSTLLLKRGAPATYDYTCRNADGSLRPFASGEYAVLSIGTVTNTGSAVLQKSTANPIQGETTVGAAVASFFFYDEDTDDTLVGANYKADVWIGGSADSPIAMDDTIAVTVQGRVNPNPPGP